MTSEEIYNILQTKFGNKILGFDSELPADSYIIVDPMAIKDICLYLRNDENLKFDTLMCLSGVDDANGEKSKDEEDMDVITGGTLSVYYNLDSIELGHKVNLKVSTPREDPKVESVESVWKCADWHEREVFDMFGTVFLNHPDLRRILMPEDWEAGYPLRKDYKNPEFYHGMKIPY